MCDPTHSSTFFSGRHHDRLGGRDSTLEVWLCHQLCHLYQWLSRAWRCDLRGKLPHRGRREVELRKYRCHVQVGARPRRCGIRPCIRRSIRNCPGQGLLSKRQSPRDHVCIPARLRQDRMDLRERYVHQLRDHDECFPARAGPCLGLET